MNGEPAHRVQFKWGPFEFSAEGPTVETVNEQYATALEFASGHVASASNVRVHGIAPENSVGRGNDDFDAARAFVFPPSNPVRSGDQNGHGDMSNTADVFIKDEHSGVISLRVLPRTATPEADTLILLLFAHLTIDNLRSVKGKLLAKGARQSGMKMEDRVVKFLEPHRSLVTRGGPTHGSTYTLTNPGIAHAKRLLSDIWD